MITISMKGNKRGRLKISNLFVVVLVFGSVAILHLLKSKWIFTMPEMNNSGQQHVIDKTTGTFFGTETMTTEETTFTSLPDIVANLATLPSFQCEKCLLNDEDKRLLYALGKSASGPVLEEGSFCGCSTASIAMGLKDGAVQAGRATPYRLVTSDAFPTSPKYPKSPNQYILEPSGGSGGDNSRGDEIVKLYVWGNIVHEIRDQHVVGMFKKDMLELIDREGSILHCLFRTLRSNGLQDDVTVVAGSSKTVPDMDYRLIFSDATHDMMETKANEPVWSKYLHRGYPVIIAFDDVAGLPDVQEYLRTKYKPVHVYQTKKAWVMQVSGK